MKNIILATMLGAFVLLAGCKKEAPQSGTDVTTPWVGVFTGNAQAGSPSQILISKVSDSTLRVEIKVTQDWYQYTATTLNNVKITNSSVAAVSETQNIIEYTNLGAYKFSGSLSLSGANVAMNVIAVSIDTTNENSPQNFAFSGTKSN